MQLRTIVVCCVLSLCPLLANSQMMQMSGKPAVGAPASPSKSLDDMLSLFEGELIPAAKAMPAEKYDFAPNASTFAAGSPEKFDTVRTFGQQVAHLAQANYFFYSALSGLKPDADVAAIAKMTKKDDLVNALVNSFAFAHKSIATITPENAFLTIKGVDGMTTRATVAAFGVAHGYDHYGQLVEYLRMNGIIPPASAK